MARLVGSNTPELTDYASQASGVIQGNILKNFESASVALQAQADMANADYKQSIQEWQNKENIRKAQAEGKGEGFLGGIAEVGRQLVAGYALISELEERRKQQKAENERAERAMTLNERELEYRIKEGEEDDAFRQEQFEYGKAQDQLQRQDRMLAAQAEAEIKTKEKAVETMLQYYQNKAGELEIQLGQLVSQVGWSQGNQAYQQEVQKLLSSEEFSALDENTKQKAYSYFVELGTKLSFDVANQEWAEQRKQYQQQLSLITTQWRNENIFEFNELQNGLGYLSPEDAVKKAEGLVTRYQKMLSDDKYKHLFNDKGSVLQSTIEVYKMVGESLNKYSEKYTEAQIGNHRFVQAANGLALLEQQKMRPEGDPNKISDLQFQVEAQRLLSSLGLGGTSYKDFPTALPNRIENDNKLLELEMKRQQLMRKNAANKAVLDRSHPAGDAAYRYLIGKYVFDNLDTPEGAIATLKVQAQEGVIPEDVANARIELFNKWGKDQQRLSDIQKERAKIAGQIEKLKYVPNAREVVVPPGTPGAPGQGLSTEYDIIAVERDTPIPGASEGQIEALNQQLTQLQLDQKAIVNQWMSYGINIIDPTDSSGLTKLYDQAAQALNIIDQESMTQGVNPQVHVPQSSAPVSPSGPSSNEVINKVNNNVLYEFNANNRRKYDEVLQRYIKPNTSTGTLAQAGRRGRTSGADTYAENLRKIPDRANWTAQSNRPIKKIIISAGHADWAESPGAPREEAVNRAIAKRMIELAKDYGLEGRIELYEPPKKYSNAELSTGKSDAMGDVGRYAEEQGAFAFEIHHNVAEKDKAANPGASNTTGGLSGVIPGVGGDGIHTLDELLSNTYGKFRADHRNGLRSPKRGITILELGGTVAPTPEYVDAEAKKLLITLARAKFDDTPKQDATYSALSNNFKTAGNLVINKVLAGDTEGAAKIISEGVNLLRSAGFPANSVEAYQSGLKDLITETTQKKNYYRNVLNQQSRSNTPPSFTSGSTAKRAEVKSAVATVSHDGTLQPALHLNGNLGTHPNLGWVPFKGGTVTITSGFGTQRSHGRHQGIDLHSSDGRVATMQGGKVKFAGQFGSFGKVVMVETSDGHVEVMAHLKDVHVKTGQYVQPADVLGTMGGSGAKGDNDYPIHLHFEVWTNRDWNHPSEATGRGIIDPHQYFSKLKSKTVLPRTTGGVANSGQSETRESKVAYHTGAVQVGQHLLFYKGMIYDKRSAQIRTATAQEREAAKSGIPEIIYRTVKETVRKTNGSGQSVRSTIDIPYRATQEGTFMMLVPAGYQVQGQDVWELQGYRNNVRMFSKPVLGVKTQDGDYKVSQTYNYSPFANPKDKELVTNFIKQHGAGRGMTMYQRSIPREELLNSAPNSGYKNGAIDLRNTMSINATDYKSFGDGSQDYGYSALRNDPKLRQAVNSAAKKLGVPEVWVADQIAMESEWNPTVKNEFGYRGYFQVKDEHLYGITQAMMDNKYRQISEAYVLYHKAIMREVGGYRNFEEFLMGVWGGGRGIRDYRAAKGHMKNTRFKYYDAYTDWDGYRKIVNKKSGRRYSWNGVNMSSRFSHYHDIPDDSCPVCNSMLRGGSFQVHFA